MQFNQLAYTVPDGLETFTIASGNNTLVLREPVAADFMLAESQITNPNMHERAFTLAIRLGVTWNGKPGVSALEIGQLTRPAYKEVLDLTSQFFLDILPEFSKELLPQHLRDKR